MPNETITDLDRRLAKVCEHCPVCRRARQKQRGLAYGFVRTVDRCLCPACRAYEKVHGRKAHEPADEGEVDGRGGRS